MSKNPNRKWNDDDDENGDADDETLRGGCCVKRRTSHESSLGGGCMELDIQSRAGISGSEKKAPHDAHGCS